MNTRGYTIATALTAVCIAGAVTAWGPSALASTRSATGIAHLASPPVLGTAHHFTRGLGASRPKVVDFGGDPTSYITTVHWTSWGGKVAKGTATACRPPANGPIAECRPTTAAVRAFRLGHCSQHGPAAYTRVEWWFPIDGKFDPKSNSVFNACSGGVR